MTKSGFLKNKKENYFAVIFLLSAIAACGPKIVVVPSKLKEIKTEREKIYIQLPDTTQKDTMIVGTPSGKIDLLFVVDNSPAASTVNINTPDFGLDPLFGVGKTSILGWFSYNYIELANRLSSLPELNYQSQVITAYTKHISGAKLEPHHHAPQIEELFPAAASAMTGRIGASGVESRILHDQTNLYASDPDASARNFPFSATTSALSSFPDHKQTPLIIVYILLNDATNTDPGETAAALHDAIVKNHRNKEQTRLLVYSDHARAQFFHPVYSAQEFQKLSQMHYGLKQFDLSDLAAAKHGSHLVEHVMNEVTDMTNGLVPGHQTFRMYLSRTPKSTEFLTVRFHNSVHFLTYGNDFHYDEATNSIVFTPAGAAILAEHVGQSVEASYTTKNLETKPDEVLTPPGIIGR